VLGLRLVVAILAAVDVLGWGVVVWCVWQSSTTLPSDFSQNTYSGKKSHTSGQSRNS